MTRSPRPRPLELLAPAANAEVARQAILHGADAVYMGASSHGARSKAANSIDDIRGVVEFAHAFRARVYVTVNTLVYEDEFMTVQKLVNDLYRIGVDALIVQDMALLRLDLPPIALHASTQCDTRSVEKARFLEQVGFSQIVLARELSVDEISDIVRSVSVPVEAFVHGALCVSYSGRCSASQRCLGRSANRGECAQMCRMPYTLRNGRGETILRDKYLLSLRDFNTLSNLDKLVEAGVSSFKIEGRLKDAAYVKNVVAAYRQRLDRIIAANPDRFCRSSFGESLVEFSPCVEKSFNRGFTDYFVTGRRPAVSMASINTPKSLGEPISDPRQLNNGDGISFFNARGEYEGAMVNGVSNGRILTSRPVNIPKGTQLYRTSDREFKAALDRETARRVIDVDISLDSTGVSAVDERGVSVRLPLECELLPADKPMDPSRIFAKLGATVYRLRSFTNSLGDDIFIRASELTALRRRLTDALDAANIVSYRFDYRRPEQKDVHYPASQLDGRDNVANSLAEQFYREHGVESIVPAVEVRKSFGNDEPVMTTRYCIRRELGCCLRDCKDKRRLERFAAPLSISTGNHSFRLDFDCARCEMNLFLQH